MSNDKLLLIGLAGATYLILSKRTEAQPNTTTQLDFSLYNTNKDEISFTNDNETVFIKGNAIINGIYENNNIFIFDNKTKTNLGYGITDIYGNFDIPIKIYGIELDTETFDILCVGYR